VSTTVPILGERGDEQIDGGEPPRGTRNRSLIIAAAVIVLVAALVVWVVAFSPLLGVKTITVRGAHIASVAQVRAAAAINSGTPLVRLDTAAVARRVGSLPTVASVAVHTSYPSTVTITVVERVALGYVQSGEKFVLVDKTGDQFRTVSRAPRGLPLFAVPSGPQAKATGEAMSSVAAALTPQLRARVASIQGFDPTAITLLLTDRRVVRWGSAERSAEKAQILPTLLAQPGSQFDLTNPDQPFSR
jgi:cell division protein FtsQ